MKVTESQVCNPLLLNGMLSWDPGYTTFLWIWSYKKNRSKDMWLKPCVTVMNKWISFFWHSCEDILLTSEVWRKYNKAWAVNGAGTKKYFNITVSWGIAQSHNEVQSIRAGCE